MECKNNAKNTDFIDNVRGEILNIVKVYKTT